MLRVSGRVRTLLRHVTGSNTSWARGGGTRGQLAVRSMCSASGSGTGAGGGSTLEIGGVAADVHTPRRKELVPFGYLSGQGGGRGLSQEVLGHLRWMMQKDGLGQDMFLVGPPGPERRRLALLYAQLLGREVEVVSISRDTTESDLKQRREIVSGSALFVDQVGWRAVSPLACAHVCCARCFPGLTCQGRAPVVSHAAPALCAIATPGTRTGGHPRPRAHRGWHRACGTQRVADAEQLAGEPRDGFGRRTLSCLQRHVR